MLLITKWQQDATVFTSRNGNQFRRGTVLRAEHSRLDWADVRALCIEKDLYTSGDCHDYDELAQLIYSWEDNDEDITAEMLQVVAEDIIEHSYDTEYNVEALMFELSKRVTRYYTVAEH